MPAARVWVWVLLGVAACAEPPPPAAVEAPVAAPEKRAKLPEMESEIGGMNEEAMDKAFNALSEGVQRCAENGAKKLASIGGELKVKLRIDRRGSARWAYVSASTIGDRDTEKCVLELARAKTWPLPVGGDGLAEKLFSVDPQKEPFALDPKEIARDIARARSDVAPCRKGVTGTFLVTAYLRADGKVTTAGLASPSEGGEQASDCMVEALRKLRFHPRVGKAAKVSFEMR